MQPKKTSFTRSEIHQLIQTRFNRVVKLYPSYPAIITPSEQISYSELDVLSDRIGYAIQHHERNPKKICAIFMEQGISSTAAILGVLKAGMSFILIPPETPSSRINAYWEETDHPIFLTTNQYKHIVIEITKDDSVILLDELPKIPQDFVFAGSDARPEDMAAIFYTSGSTGEPKGVIWTHELILHTAFLNTQSYSITSEDKIAILSAFGYGAAMTMSFAAMLNGAALCFYPTPQQTPTAFLQWVSDNNISILSMTTLGLLRQVLHEMRGPSSLKKVRMVILGGDDLYRADVNLFFDKFPMDTIFVYRLAGSETMLMREIKITPSTKLLTDKVPVGYEVPDKELLLLNEELKPVSKEEVGEIAIRSRYLSPGYWKQPELTAKKFLKDPVNEDMRIYLTGDLGRLNGLGQLEFLGRKDNMVKVRGFSVQLEAIEQRLVAIRGIKEAVVVLRSWQGRSRLTAYLKSEGSDKPSANKIKNELASVFPQHSIPSVYCWVDSIPRTSTGKVDRSNLPDVLMERPELSSVYEAAENAIEVSLVEIWQKILGIKDIGVNDSFFELGGDSLSSLEMVLEVEQAHHISVPQSFFTNPVIKTLAKSILENEEESVLGRKFSITSKEQSESKVGIKKKKSRKFALLKKIFSGKTSFSEIDWFTGWYRFFDRKIGKYLVKKSYQQAIAWSVRFSNNWFVCKFLYNHRQKLFRRWLNVLKSSTPDIRGSFGRALLTNMFFYLPRPVTKQNKDPYKMGQIYLNSKLPYWKSLGELIETTTAENIPTVFPMVGLSYIQSARSEGRGVILLSFHGTPHPGGFVPLAKFLGIEGIPTISYLIPIRQSQYDEQNDEISETTAFKLNAEIALYGQKILNNGGVVNFASDTNDERGRVFKVKIANRLYFIKGGFAEMALNTGAVVVPYTRYTLDDGRVQIEFFNPMEPGKGTRDEKVEKMIRDYAAFMEKCWIDHPDSMSWIKMRNHLRKPK